MPGIVRHVCPGKYFAKVQIGNIEANTIMRVRRHPKRSNPRFSNPRVVATAASDKSYHQFNHGITVTMKYLNIAKVNVYSKNHVAILY